MQPGAYPCGSFNISNFTFGRSPRLACTFDQAPIASLRLSTRPVPCVVSEPVPNMQMTADLADVASTRARIVLSAAASFAVAMLIGSRTDVKPTLRMRCSWAALYVRL